MALYVRANTCHPLDIQDRHFSLTARTAFAASITVFACIAHCAHGTHIGGSLAAQARYASTPASSSLLSPGEGSVKMKLHRGDEPHMEISFRSTGATRYELYFGRKESETREQFKYWCGVQKGGSVFKTLTFTQTSKSDVVHTDIFLSERADGTICVAGDENVRSA
eukprot:4054278-Pleurochrysis_carterae.AAC.6